MNLVQSYEKAQIEALTKDKTIPEFRVGDTVTVSVAVVEDSGSKRMQAYKGVVIGRHNRGLGSTFRVRKAAAGEGVERVFHLYSPNIQITVERLGKVRRAKLYYLRDRSGKSARIAERTSKA